MLLVLVPAVVLAATVTQYSWLGTNPCIVAIFSLGATITDNVSACLRRSSLGSAVTVYPIINPRASSRVSSFQLTATVVSFNLVMLGVGPDLGTTYMCTYRVAFIQTNSIVNIPPSMVKFTTGTEYGPLPFTV